MSRFGCFGQIEHLWRRDKAEAEILVENVSSSDVSLAAGGVWGGNQAVSNMTGLVVKLLHSDRFTVTELHLVMVVVWVKVSVCLSFGCLVYNVCRTCDRSVNETVNEAEILMLSEIQLAFLSDEQYKPQKIVAWTLNLMVSGGSCAQQLVFWVFKLYF